jgi:GT2 family glycosyltransferase
VHLLPTCLSALREQTWRDFEVIVVDNGSTDDSLALLGTSFPEAGIVALSENLGFAAAANEGIRRARGEILVLLNNDTQADQHWLANLITCLESHPEAGLAASKLRLFDDRQVIHSAGDCVTLAGIPVNRGVWQTDHGQFDGDEYVFSACAGAAAYRRSMLGDVGLFDTAFGSYCEDVDLAWRAQLRGWRCVFAPQAVVYHRLSATGGGARASYFAGRNFVYLVAKNYPSALLVRNLHRVLRAQMAIAMDGLRAWRGQAARARLRGLVVGLLSWPRMLPARWHVQTRRRLSDSELGLLLTRCDAGEANGWQPG